MSLKAWEEVAAEPLSFPINGKLYTVRPVGIAAGRRLADVVAGDEKKLADMPADEIWRLVLGPTWDEMLTDDVPGESVTRAGMTAYADHRWGRDVAVAIWETGASPEALAARMAAPKTSTNTGGAKRTRSRASTKVTTSPPTTRRATKKAPTGKRSSSSGR